MKEKIDLMTCPFCGVEPEFYFFGNTKNGEPEYFLGCNNSNCLMEDVSTELHTDKKLLAKKWNSRAYTSVLTTNKEFSRNIFLEILKENKDNNILISPFSIYSALSMAYSGAVGETAEQIRKVLCTECSPDEIIYQNKCLYENFIKTMNRFPDSIKIANGIFAANDMIISENYLDKFKENDFSSLKRTNFYEPEIARCEINSWIEKMTENKIKEIIPYGTLNEIIRLILVNTIYYSASWENAFQSHLVFDEKFYGNKGETDIKLMYQYNFYNYFETKKLQVLEIPYKNNETSMIFILPKGGKFGYNEISGDQEIAHFLKEGGFDFFIDGLNGSKVKIAAWIPKLKINYYDNLYKTLSTMGIKLALSHDADFSGITKEKPLFISDVIHSSYLDLTESGTESAAATIVGFSGYSGVSLSDQIVFKANKPFMFFINHKKTNNILFVGKFSNVN